MPWCEVRGQSRSWCSQVIIRLTWWVTVFTEPVHWLQALLWLNVIWVCWCHNCPKEKNYTNYDMYRNLINMRIWELAQWLGRTQVEGRSSGGQVWLVPGWNFGIGVTPATLQCLRVAVAFWFVLCDMPFSPDIMETLFALERKRVYFSPQFERLKVHDWADTCLGSVEGLMVAA